MAVSEMSLKRLERASREKGLRDTGRASGMRAGLEDAAQSLEPLRLFDRSRPAVGVLYQNVHDGERRAVGGLPGRQKQVLDQVVGRERVAAQPFGKFEMDGAAPVQAAV